MIKLIFDCLRSPYDFANIIQVALATNECEIYVTGNSLRHDHQKIAGKVASWSKKIRKDGYPFGLSIRYLDTLQDCIKELKQSGVRVIGTSPHASKSFFDLDLSGDDYAIVFGTESGGLSKEKMAYMDELVKLPMSNNLDFMTLSTVVPVVVYEAERQRLAKEPSL